MKIILVIIFIILVIAGIGNNEKRRLEATENSANKTQKQVKKEIRRIDYKVAKERDSSFGNVRSRVILEVEAIDANNDDERMLVMMNATIERHRKDWTDAISVRFLVSLQLELSHTQQPLLFTVLSLLIFVIDQQL